jgi:hypothetical protein
VALTLQEDDSLRILVRDFVRRIVAFLVDIVAKSAIDGSIHDFVVGINVCNQILRDNVTSDSPKLDAVLLLQ